MRDLSDRPVVIASNRGPLSFYLEADGAHGEHLVGRRGGGGLVSGLAPLVESGQATWIAAALSEADRLAAVSGTASAEGLEVRLLDLDLVDQRLYYDTISNSTLWFIHHNLYDLTREPSFDRGWWDAWDAYRRVNHAFADAVVEHAPEGATVLVQDYHLTLLANRVRAGRDDLRLVHFHHTPFAGPDGARILPPRALEEMLTGLAGHDACGFHTPEWASNYAQTQLWFGGRNVTTFQATLNSDADDLRAVAAGDRCGAALAGLEEIAGDRLVVARVDRMELSKNIVRGFAAYDRLLERRADLRGRVVFIACCYPSRLGVPDYARYAEEVAAAVDAVNERWGDDGWAPIVLMDDDDHPRSVALLRRYDALLVNPIRDGLNLVAKEGPMVNEHDGQLVLSTEAGAWYELEGAADGTFPFDIEQTSVALEVALDRPADERRERARQLRELATARTPADWLADQLDAG